VQYLVQAGTVKRKPGSEIVVFKKKGSEIVVYKFENPGHVTIRLFAYTGRLPPFYFKKFLTIYVLDYLHRCLLLVGVFKN
jgi:hypothetical protein